MCVYVPSLGADRKSTDQTIKQDFRAETALPSFAVVVISTVLHSELTN
jgi:hypothetical protein